MPPDARVTPEIEDATQLLGDLLEGTPGFPDDCSKALRRMVETLGNENAATIVVEISDRTPKLLRDFADKFEIERGPRVAVLDDFDQDAEPVEAEAEPIPEGAEYDGGVRPPEEVPGHYSETAEDFEERAPIPSLDHFRGSGGVAPTGAHVPDAGFGAPQPKVRKRTRAGEEEVDEAEMVIEQPKVRERKDEE